MDDVTKVKERINIVDVVGEYVKLTKAGRNYKGLSPFKKEKTPSFFVSPDKNMFYDFSSNRGGDVFTFLQEMEGVDFRGALTMLAERAGVQLSGRSEGNVARDEKDALFDAMEKACAFFETKFQESSEATGYITGRGVTPAIARRFRIGYAPEGWHVLRDFLTAAGVPVATQEKAGLIKQSEKGSSYDRFRSRIMFPIADSSGRIIAFSGRIIGEAAQDEHNAKYLNSPDTPLFDKSTTLYGYDKAKQPMRQNDFAIVVEGQMDIVLCHQAGYANTVATSGTALTTTHLSLIARLTKNVAFAFDADSAGIAAVRRAADIALRMGMEVKVIAVPHGKDPADCIKEDPEAWKRAVRDARSVVDFLLTHIDAQHYSEAKRATAVRDIVLPLIATMQSGMTRGFYVHRVAEHLGLAEHAVWEDVARAGQGGQSGQTESAPAGVAQEKAEDAAASMSAKALLEREIAALLFWQEGAEERVVSEQYLAELLEQSEVSIEGMLAVHADEKDTLALRGEVLLQDAGGTPEEVLASLVRAYARMVHEERRDALRRDIRTAEHSQDEATLDALLKEFQVVQQKIQALMEA